MFSCLKDCTLIFLFYFFRFQLVELILSLELYEVRCKDDIMRLRQVLTTQILTLQRFYRCMESSKNNTHHSIVHSYTLTHNAHHRSSNLVPRGSSLRKPLYCCLASKQTSPLPQHRFLRSSNHSNWHRQVHTKLKEIKWIWI